jgi:hypothetical protein
VASVDDFEAFLYGFYNNLADRPLEPDDPFYVPFLVGSPSDPIDALAFTIESRRESAQLFSGFRGSGKSTELLRLRHTLKQRGYLVVFRDLLKYVGEGEPIDVGAFLLAVAGAFGDGLEEEGLLSFNPAKPSFWDHIVGWMRGIKLDGASLGAPDGMPVSVELKLNLKSDPVFRVRLQQQLGGHLGALTDEVRSFMGRCLAELRASWGAGVKIVLVLDSFEKLRGSALNESDVQASVDRLFNGHADKLHFEGMHVVYSVPPWLKVLSNAAALFDKSVLLPCLKVADYVQESQGWARRPLDPAITTARTIIEKRGNWQRLLGSREDLVEHMVFMSGGYLRDLFRTLERCLQRARNPALTNDPDQLVELALADLHNDYTPMPHADILWLDDVRRTHEASLPDAKELPRLARFFDNHVVLCYRNGHEWFAVHPILESTVAESAERLRKSRLDSESGSHTALS